MKTLSRYLSVYNSLLRVNIKRAAAYRMDAIFGSVMASTLWTIFQISNYYLLTLQIKEAFGWTRNELMLLSVTYSLSAGLVSVLFMRTFSDLPDIINRGQLDMYLLKPIDSQFMITNQNMSLTSSIRMFLGIILVVIFMPVLGITTTVANVISFSVLLLFGALALYSAMYILNTFLIWFPQLDNITDLFYTLRGVGRFPSGLFRASSEFLFLLLAPFIISVSIPTRALIGKVTTGEVVELIGISVGLFIVSRIFWKYALRSYTSANG